MSHAHAGLAVALSLILAAPTFAQQTAAPANGNERTIVLDAPDIGARFCEGAIELTYQQRNTIARVEGRISNPTCAASSGNYELAISYRDESGQRQTMAVTETWQRSDAADVSFTSDYEIGENVDLVSVRARRVRCECAQAPAE